MKILFDLPRQRPNGLVAADLVRRVLGNIGWDTLGALFGRGLPVLGMMIVARILGPEEFGSLTIVYTTVLMFEIFAVLGLQQTTTRFVAAYRVSEPLRAGQIISFCSLMAIASGAIIALGSAIAAPWLAEHALAAPHLSDGLRLGSILIFFSAWMAAQRGALTGLEAFKLLAFVNALSGLATIAALVFGAAMFGFDGAVAALVLGTALAALFHHLALRRSAKQAGIPLVRSFLLQDMSIIWRFSLPGLATGVLWMPVNWATNAMLANTEGGYEQLGMLGVAMQWYVLLLFLPNIVAKVLLPVVTERLSAGVKDDAITVTNVTILIIVISMTAVAFSVVLASPWIMSFYGDTYLEGSHTLAFIAIAAAASSPQNLVESYFAAKDRMWFNAAFNLLWAVLMIVGASLLVEKGAVGIAAAMACAYTVRTFVSFSAFKVFSRRDVANG